MYLMQEETLIDKEGFVLKKMIGIGIALVAMIMGFILYNGSRGSGLTVHDLDWSDYEGMNAHVSEMTMHIPPIL